MRTVTIGSNHQFDIPGLTRKQLRELKADKIDLSDIPKENADDIVDRVLSMALTKEQIKILEDLENKWTLVAWRTVLAETYGAPEEEKNSSAT